MILARILCSYGALLTTLIFRPKALPKTRSRNKQLLMPLLLGWTGMRGVVSLAAALSIPVTFDNGVPFPNRNLILFITFVVILLTLVVQGLTLPILISKTKLFDGLSDIEPEEDLSFRIKNELKQHVYNALKNKYDESENKHIKLETMIKHWEERTKIDNQNWMDEKGKALFLEVIESQRIYLAELNKDNSINEDLIKKQLYQLDLEEERLKII